MPRVKFIVNNIRREKEIVNMVQENLDFLKKNKIRFTWPEKRVEDEYNKKIYEDYKKWLGKEWRKKENKFVEKLLHLFNRPKNTKFNVEVSNYGPLGFYNTRNNTITINLNTHLDVVDTIKHEMIHIMIESFVRKYELSYTDKERVVNIVFNILS